MSNFFKPFAKAETVNLMEFPQSVDKQYSACSFSCGYQVECCLPLPNDPDRSAVIVIIVNVARKRSGLKRLGYQFAAVLMRTLCCTGE